MFFWHADGIGPAQNQVVGISDPFAVQGVVRVNAVFIGKKVKRNLIHDRVIEFEQDITGVLRRRIGRTPRYDGDLVHAIYPQDIHQLLLPACVI